MAVLPTLPAELPAGGLQSVAGPAPEGALRVALTGFMGSGKTTVGGLLATQLGWAFADLDTCIAARLGLSVPQIFTLQGEAAFRAAEVEELGRLLVQPRQVIALGGGAPGTPEIRRLLQNSAATVVIQLQAPFEVLYRRCQLQAEDPAATSRPLLGDSEAASLRYRERLALYHSVAHWTAETTDASPAAVASAIVGYLANRLA